MLIVRWLHVFAVAALVGGATLVWGVVEVAARDGDAPPVVLCRTYEWLFWGAAGALAMTGVGNLGAIGRGLPDAGTAWGSTLALKLLFVLALFGLSALRTLAVCAGERRIGALRVGYGATVVWSLVVVALAEVLAHG